MCSFSDIFPSLRLVGLVSSRLHLLPFFFCLHVIYSRFVVLAVSIRVVDALIRDGCFGVFSVGGLSGLLVFLLSFDFLTTQAGFSFLS